MPTNFSFNDYLVIDTTGSVGIGSTNPQARLFVTGSSTVTSQPTVIFRPGTTNQLGGVGVLDVQNSSGTSLFFVSGSGKVGVGVTNPGYTLDVGGAIAIRGNETADNPRLYFQASDLSNRFTIESDLDGTTTNDILGFRSTATDNILVIKGNGYVAIGSSSPAAALDVNKVGGIPDIRLSNAGTAYMNLYGGSGVGSLNLIAVQNEPLVFGTNNTEKVRIDSSGNVGIGTTVLVAKLTVSSSTASSMDIQLGRAFAVLNNNTGSINFVSYPSVGTRGSHDYGALVVRGNSPSGINDGGSAIFDLKVGGASSTQSSDVGVFMRAQAIVGTSNGADMVSLYSRNAVGLVVSGSSQYVGIGTTVPAYPLHVYRSGLADGSTNTHLMFDGKFAVAGIDQNDMIGMSSRLENSGGGSQTTFNIGFSYQAGANAILLQPTAGYVGIGTNNPLSKLHVVSGDLRFDNTYGIIGATNTAGYVLRGDNTRFVPAQLQYSDLGGTPTIGNATLTVGVSGTGLSISATPTFTANATSNNTITITSNATSSNTVSTLVARDASGDFSAGRLDAIIISSDTRAVTTTPETLTRAGVVFDFKDNTTNALSDGGSYHGLMTFRQYGSSTDWSGGRSHQLGFTDNDNVWHRSGTSTTWGTWYKFYHTGNLTNPTTGTGTSNYVARWTGTGTLGTGVLYDNGTNVGIGISSPGYLLHLSQNGNTQVWISATNAGTNSAGISLENAGQRNWQVWADRTNDALQFGSNSRAVVNMVINNVGNVGVGTNNPTYPFYVNGRSYSTSWSVGSTVSDLVNNSPWYGLGGANIGIGTAAYNATQLAGYYGLHFRTAGGYLSLTDTGKLGLGGLNPVSRFEVTGSGNTSSTSTMHLLNSSNTSMLYVRDDGSVGIGTNNPAVNLEVYNSAGAQVRVRESAIDLRMNAQTSSGGLVGTYSAHPLVLFTNSVEQVRITSAASGAASVGIGTNSPGAKLHINGGSLLIDNGTNNQLSAMGDGNIELSRSGGGAYIDLKATSAADYDTRIQSVGSGVTADLSITTSGYGEVGRFTYTGRLGLGVTNPDVKLYVKTTAAEAVKLESVVAGSPANYDAQEVFQFSTTSNVSGLSFSTGPDDNRLMTATVSPNNEVVWRANKVGLAATSHITLKTGGTTEAVRIDSSQRVGIGTATTSNKLAVYDSSQDQIYIRGTSTNRAGIRIDNTAGQQSQILFADGGTDKWQLGKQTDNTFFLYDATAAKNIIKGTSSGSGRSDISLVPYQDGRAGIGTDPSTNGKLEIYATGSLQGIYQSNGTQWLRMMVGTTTAGAYNNITAANDSAIIFSDGSVDSGAFVLAPWASGTKGLKMDSSGRVGIGTATMTRNLVVHGSDALINSLTVGRGSTSADSTNSALGSSANSTVTSGQYNTAVGFYANRQSNGGENTAVGYVAMDGNTASYNTAVGSQALYAVTSGPYNTAVGYKSLYSAGESNNSVGVGAEAGYGGSSSGRTAIGYQALKAAAAAYSTAVGYRSLAANTTGTNNVGLGAFTLELNDTGNNNTAIGANALLKLSKYDRNTAVGANAMATSTQGQDSVAVGYYALYSTNTDVANTAIGSYALQSATSGYNVGIGYSSLYSVSTGGFNVAIGPQAGTSITTGAGNVVIGGYGAGGAFATQSNNIFISDGSANLRMIITGSNGYVGIGNTQPSSSVTVYNSTTNSTAAVEVQAPPYSGVSLSTAKFSLSIAGTEYGRMQVRYGLTAAAETVLAAVGSGQALAFETNAARAVTVDTSQRVGVGTNAPDTTANTKFHVYNGNAIFNSTYGINWTGLTGPTNGTRTATTLDHYDYGTWTPVFAGSTTAGSYTLANTKAYYVRVGKLVVVSMYTEVSSVGSAGSGDWRITSLPYSSSSGVGVAAVGRYTGLASNVATISGAVEEGNTYVEMYVTTANGTANTKAPIQTYVAAGTKIAMTITFRVT
jgi:hypothetical protein